MLIRLLVKDDAAAYRSLRLKSYQESPLAFSESYEDESLKGVDGFAAELIQLGKPPEWFVLGAFEEEQLIGFVKFRRDQRSKARHKSMIHAMYVDDTVRGQGVGEAIMKALLQLVDQLDGLEQIHLWVLSAKGETAANFYQNLGFIRQGPLVKKDLKVGETYIDAEYMVMYLDKSITAKRG